jgi:hypothetical protein
LKNHDETAIMADKPFGPEKQAVPEGHNPEARAELK